MTLLSLLEATALNRNVYAVSLKHDGTDGTRYNRHCANDKNILRTRVN